MAWFALAGQVVFVAAWLVAGALEEGYSHVEHHVSELGADTAEAPLIVNGALLLLGLTLVALAAGTWEALRRSRRTLVLIAFLVAGGVTTALTGVFEIDCNSLDPGCERRFDAGDLTSSERGHVIAGLAMYPTLLPVPFLLAWATWGGKAARPAVIAGVLGVLAAGAGFLGGGDEELGGLGQRFGFASMHVGIGLYALGLLVWAGRPRRRPRPATADTSELEPFRFLGPSLSGRGENSYAPWTWWARLPRRLRFDRRVEYGGEATWHIHDTLDYEDGPTFERHLVARPLSADRMLLTGEDMPGGGVTVLQPDGLDLEPCWILVPWWGIDWPQRWRGGMRFEDGDGAVRAEFTFSMFGLLPMGRLRARLATGDRARSALPA